MKIFQPPLNRLPPEPPMPPHFLARDFPGLRQLVQRRERHAQVLRRFCDRHHFRSIVCHVLPRCLGMSRRSMKSIVQKRGAGVNDCAKLIIIHDWWALN